VATSKPDGYTLLMALVSVSVLIKILREGMRQAVKEPEVVNSHAKLDTPISYMDADEFNAWWAQDAAKLAVVVQKIGKVESAP